MTLEELLQIQFERPENISDSAVLSLVRMVLAHRGPKLTDERGYIWKNDASKRGGGCWLSPRGYVSNQLCGPARTNWRNDVKRVRGGRTVPVGSLAWARMLRMYCAAYALGQSVDHVVELTEGGDHTPENIQVITKADHQAKTLDYWKRRYAP